MSSTHLHQEPADGPTAAVLWVAVLTAPVAWVLGIGADYSLVRIACTEEVMLPLHLVTLVSLALAFMGGEVARRQWRGGGFSWREVQGGQELSRTAFMSAIGMLGSVFFSLVIVVQWLGKLFLHPCMGI